MDISELTVTVIGELYPGKDDPSSLAAFANSDRADLYAQAIMQEYFSVGIFVSGIEVGRLTRSE